LRRNLSSPVTSPAIEKSYYLMFDDRIESFPVVRFMPQQFFIFPDGTYSGTLDIQEIRNQVSGLSARLPIDYSDSNR